MRKHYGFRTYRVLELALYDSLGKLLEPESIPRFLLTNQKNFSASRCERKLMPPIRTMPRKAIRVNAS